MLTQEQQNRSLIDTYLPEVLPRTTSHTNPEISLSDRTPAETHTSKNGKPLRILITGASRGIGRAIALECARRGAIVGANYCRSVKEAESLQAAFPDNIRLLQFDVRDFDAVHDAFNSFVKNEGGLDVLVNNAGVGGRPQFLVKSSQDVIEHIMAVNILGTTYCTKAALQSMVKARKGQIVNISSISANNPMCGMSMYSATKSAIEAMVINVAKEYSSRKICSYGVRFGLVNTDMTKDLIAAAAASGITQEVLQPEDVALVVADLMFGVTSHVSGSIISMADTIKISA